MLTCTSHTLPLPQAQADPLRSTSPFNRTRTQDRDGSTKDGPVSLWLRFSCFPAQITVVHLTLLLVRFLTLLRVEKMTGSGSVSNFVIEHANQVVVVVKK